MNGRRGPCTVTELPAALEEFEVALWSAGLMESTIGTYVDRSRYFHALRLVADRLDELAGWFADQRISDLAPLHASPYPVRGPSKSPSAASATSTTGPSEWFGQDEAEQRPEDPSIARCGMAHCRRRRLGCAILVAEPT